MILNERMKYNLKVYIRSLPYLGVIIGIIAFIFAYFIYNRELLFSILYSLMFFVGHLLVWIPANIITKKW